MARVRPVKRTSGAWKWAIVVILGVAIGVLAGTGYKLLNVSNTTVGQMLRPPFGGKRFIRILVLGEDNTHKSKTTGRGLSDTIMVAAVDMDTKSVRAISIPRDTRIEISDHGAQKINAAFPIGGPELTIQAVQSILGVGVDYYIKTDIAGLKNIVDLVGGVGIEVEKNMRYRDRRGGLYINLKKGYRHLDGDKALQYVRFRHDALGDITRIQRQQKFLRALARQMLAPGNWVHLPGLVDQIYSKGYVATNLNLKDMEALSKLARDVPPDQMEMETAPGAPENISGISYYIVDLEKTSELAIRLLQPSPAGGSGAVARVEVLNGSGIYGLAKAAADRLQQSGYTVTSTGNAPSFDYASSQIIVHNEKASAVEIAQLVGASDIRTDDAGKAATDGVDITVIIGKDYRQ